MNLERGFSPPPAERAPVDKEALQRKREALKDELKVLESFGDAGEIAATKKQIRELKFQIQGIPKSEWKQRSAEADAAEKAEFRGREDFISEDSDIGRSRSDKPISELAREAREDVERREDEAVPLEMKEVFDDITDTNEYGERIVSVSSSEFAALKRNDREARVAELKKVVDRAYDESNTEDVAKRNNLKIPSAESRAATEIRENRASEAPTEIMEKGGEQAA